jgi:transcription initiation factor TFIIB
MIDVKKYEELFDISEEHKDKIVDELANDENVVFCSDCKIPCITHGLYQWECKKCGMILEQFIDSSAEWRQFDGNRSDLVRASTVINNLLPDSSKGTIIMNSSKSTANQRRVQKVHQWSAMSYKERSLNNIFQDITLRSMNGCILGNVTRLAHEFYKTISEMYTARGPLRKGLIAACLFMACKKQGVPRTCQEIAEIFQITDKWVTRGNKKFIELWNQAGKEYITYNGDYQSMDYLARFCSKLYQDNGDFLKVSRNVSVYCRNNSILSQNTPVSVAASSIYMATIILKIESKVTRADIAKIAKTSQVTIGKCHKELLKYSEIMNLST